MHNTWQLRFRPLGLLGISLMGISTIFVTAQADAATPADWQVCERGSPAAKQIAACTKIIDNRAESNADRIKAFIARGRARSNDKDIDGGYADVGEAIKLDPKRADSYDTRASMMAYTGEVDRPIADYSAAIDLEPTAYRLSLRGELYRKKGNRELAAADFRQTVAILNHEIAAHPEFAYLYRSRSDANRNLGEIDKALSDFAEFLKRKKDSDDPQLSDRGDLYLRKGDFDRAIADFSAAINKQPDSEDRYGRRALAYRLKGDYKRAILDYDQMVKFSDSNPETFMGRGLAYVAAGKPERAAVDFTKAIDLFPEDATAFYNRAQAERESGNIELAIGDYSAAIERDPHYAIAFNSRGRAYMAQNDSARGLEDFDEAIRLNDKFAAAYCSRAFLHQAAGRIDDAIEDFGRTIAADPANKDFLVARAVAFAAGTAYAKAEKDFSAALAIDPVDTVAYVGRAAARLKLSEPEKGLDDANRALVLDNANISAHSVRAEIYQALGQADKAGADRRAAESSRIKQEEARRAIETARKHPRVKVTISGDFPKMYVTTPFKLDTVVEVRDDEITYRTSGLQPYKMSSGDKIEEKFFGVCSGKPASDQGTRVVTAAVDKYLIYVDLQSRLDFQTGGCRGRHNYYKENFLIDFSDGGCKFTYRQDRDLFGVGAFDNKVVDQSCIVEPLK